jgi:hypothetical protein
LILHRTRAPDLLAHAAQVASPQAAVCANADVIDWLEAGDVAVRYQARRDLLDDDDAALQARIAREGWGREFLACRNPDGSWGRGFYQPKWTSSHYTLLDLKTLALPARNPVVHASVLKILKEEKKADGGIGPGRSIPVSDVCVNGMFLNYASYFGAPEAGLCSIVDFILSQHMPDGGFNCQSNRAGARHSSMHSTLSVLEGAAEYEHSDYRYRLADLRLAAAAAREFLLQHRLFKSDRSGAIIRDDFLRLSFPSRWKYNVLRALDHFRAVQAPWDDRLSDAIEVIESKRRADGRWSLAAAHPGAVHFTMERAGGPSRWNTLLALRVLRAWGLAERQANLPRCNQRAVGDEIARMNDDRAAGRQSLRDRCPLRIPGLDSNMRKPGFALLDAEHAPVAAVAE